MSERPIRRTRVNTEFVSTARRAIENNEGSSLKPWEATFIGSMAEGDEPELLAYLIERHRAQRTGRYGKFLMRYFPQEEAA